MFSPKMRGGLDPIWTGSMFSDGRGRWLTSYVLVSAESTRWSRETSRGVIEVRKVAEGGWDVVLFGDVTERFHTKTDAQIAVEQLLGVRS